MFRQEQSNLLCILALAPHSDISYYLPHSPPSPPSGIAGKYNRQQTFQQFFGGGGEGGHQKYLFLFKKNNDMKD